MARWDQVMSGEKSWGKWWLDQLGHTGLGTAYALPFEAMALLWFGAPILMTLMWGALVALFGGVVREVVGLIKTGKLHPIDRLFDALFHLPGAAVALGIVLLIRLAV
jgi:hypothetical protein